MTATGSTAAQSLRDAVAGFDGRRFVRNFVTVIRE